MKNDGFTLIELIAVLVIVSILAAVAIPTFTDLSSEARVATLRNIKSSMVSTVTLVKAHALTQGIRAAPENPGGSSQTDYVVQFNGAATEVDWRNLCPESRAEVGDRLTMLDFIDVNETGGLSSSLNNQYTLIGYDIPGFSVPTDSGCYVIYDSFGDPDCTVTLVTEDC